MMELEKHPIIVTQGREYTSSKIDVRTYRAGVKVHLTTSKL
jgi:hypothetical protein